MRYLGDNNLNLCDYSACFRNKLDFTVISTIGRNLLSAEAWLSLKIPRFARNDKTH